jgi:hypothetical protein
MIVEFTYAPVSGQFDEKQFDLGTEWKSAEWCWVKFSLDNTNVKDWYGSFRGTAKYIAIANQLRLVGVLTSDCLYIINPDTKDVLFSDPQTTVQELTTDSLGSKFILADWTSFQFIDNELIIKDVPSDLDCDNIKFGQVRNNKLELEFEEVPGYEIKKGLLDLQTWTLEHIK